MISEWAKEEQIRARADLDSAGMTTPSKGSFFINFIQPDTHKAEHIDLIKNI